MLNRRHFLLTTAAAAAATAAGRPAFAQVPTLRLGYQLPLTGQHAQYGQDFKNAAEIQLARFHAANKPFKVEIVYEDSRSDAKEGVAIARKFVDDKAILGVLGDFTSTVAMASAQVYAQAGLPQLSQTSSHPDYTKISKWQFRNITTQAQEGPYNAEWMLARGFKKMAVICEQSDWGQTVVSNYVDALKAKGGSTVFNEFYNRGLQDFRPIITKIAREKPDAIYTGFFYEDAAQFLKQVKQLGVTIPVHSTSAAYNSQTLTLAGDAAEGMHLTVTFLPNSTSPNVQEFVKLWKEKTGEAESGQFPAQAYDAVGIMLAALERAYPNPTRDKLREELAKTTNYPGVTGDTTFDKDREPAKKLAKAVVKDGKFIPTT